MIAQRGGIKPNLPEEQWIEIDVEGEFPSIANRLFSNARSKLRVWT